ncbi:MAG: hypothetical protein RH942_10635 [Kiloniellaceae bacterium]
MVAGLSGTAFAQSADLNSSSATNTLNQTVTNSASNQDDENANDGIAGSPDNALNNNFGDTTFENGVMNQNNINSGINSAQQGGNAAAIAVDGDGVGGGSNAIEKNLATAKNTETQTATNTAKVDTEDDDDESDGIAGDPEHSLNNNFGSDTFDNQAINQNNINSGINSAQQGANAAALAVDLDGASGNNALNEAKAENKQTQTVINEAKVGEEGDDDDGIGGEADHSFVNDFGNQTFENQAINQNNINSGINSAQQGANTVAIAASAQDSSHNGTPNPLNTVSFGVVEIDSETQAAMDAATALVLDAFDLNPTALGGNGGDPEDYETNKATATTMKNQTVTNTAKVTDDGNGDDNANDGGIGGDAEDSLSNEFGDDTFRGQVLNQNNINSGINSAQQSGNTAAIAVDIDEGSNTRDINIATATADETQKFTNKAEVSGEDNDGVGGFDGDGDNEDTLYNNFGDNTFQDQVINQNNINAGINNGQQGMNTTAMAIDASDSTTDLNTATASSKGRQNGENKATDSSEGDKDDDDVVAGHGVGGSPAEDNLNNKFGEYTFQNQVINQNNINSGINSAQQGANTAAIAVADEGSTTDKNTSTSTSDLRQGTGQVPLKNLASATGEDSGGVGGNPEGPDDDQDPLSNAFGDYTFQEQVINQNNINSGINSAQQGANTVAMAIDLGGPGGLDVNNAVSIATLSQTVTNTATVSGDSNAGVGGGAEYALNNNFGSNTFQNQVMNQNNINSGINSVQQGANTVAIAFSGAAAAP